jgi:hypothetical protein
MLGMLEAEGFRINDRELTRVRLRFKWNLRESRSTGPQKRKPKRRKKSVALAGNTLVDQLASAILQEADTSSEGDFEEEEATHREASGEPTTELPPPPPQLFDDAEALQRHLRKQQLRAESDSKRLHKKRRRRTRGWAGLPADAPGEPPRFPSETTIDESKAYLSLSNALYRQMRDQFQAICEEQGVLKKTVAGPEKWNQLLQQLVRENAHLANVFGQEANGVSIQQSDATWRPQNYKALSLDVICQDVTKRMRTMDSRMGMAEARNVLGLDPEQTRQVKSAFLKILESNSITAKLEIGYERWTQLKRQWLQGSELLSRLIAAEEVPVGSEAGSKHSPVVRAVEVLARDVMKRHQATLAKQNAGGKRQAHQGPGPGPAPPSAASLAIGPRTRGVKRLRAGSHRSLPQDSGPAVSELATDLEIDPSLLLAANDAAFFSPDALPIHPSTRLGHQHHMHIQHANGSADAQQHEPTFPPSTSGPTPVYFRIHPYSTTPYPSKTVWLSILQSGTLAELKTLATQAHPGTTVMRLEGLLVHRSEGMEKEVAVAIDDDAELGAFLGHVQGGKATFVVMLAAGEGGGYT